MQTTLKEQRRDLLNEIQGISAKAQSEHREFSTEEKKIVDQKFARIEELDKTLTAQNKLDELQAEEYRQLKASNDAKAKILSGSNIGFNAAAPSRTTWTDADGEPVRAVFKGERWNNGTQQEKFSLGNVVRAVATGKRRYAEYEFKNAMTESDNTAGGILVPDVVSGRVIDLARANSAVAQAGAVFVPMTSETLTLAKITRDPTFETHAENQTISESDFQFGGCLFVSRTIATMVRMSRELAADAPNIAQLTEEALARALAIEVDRQGMAGDGSQEEVGLVNVAGISETTSVGAIAWEDVHGGAVAVRVNNYQPNAYICHPTIAGDLDILTSGDGSTASKNWLGAPPSLNGVSRYETTNVTTANLIVGDFTKCAFGLREGAMIEATTVGGDAFSKHSVLVKAVWRGCFRVLLPGAFHRLTGITT